MLSREEQWYEAMSAEQSEPTSQLVNAARYKAKNRKKNFLESEEEQLVAVILGLNALVFMMLILWVMGSCIQPVYKLSFIMVVLGLSYLPCFIYLIAKERSNYNPIKKEGL